MSQGVERLKFFRGLIRALCEEGFGDFDQISIPPQFWRQEEQSLLAFIRTATRGRPSPHALDLLAKQADVDLTDVPFAAVSYWLTELRNVFLHERITAGCAEVLEALTSSRDDSLERAKGLLLAAAYNVGQMVESAVPEDLLSEERIVRIFHDMAQRPAISTPFKELNDAVGGFKAGELFTFCAMSGVGKTMMLLMFALHAVRHGKRVLFINTEMSNDDLLLRLISFMGLDTAGWRSHMPKEEDQSYVRLQIQSAKFKNAFKAKEYGHHRKLEDVEYDILSVRPDIVCVDSAYELQMRKFESRDDHLRKAEVFSHLKDLAKRHKIPILANSQMNQARSEADDEPSRMLFNQSRVAYTQAIARVSDYVFYLQCVPQETMHIRIIPAKFRSSARCDHFIIDTRLKTTLFHAPLYMASIGMEKHEDTPI
ncbi:MAG: DnaB-like helicase C-terminal domain-containing protein [Luteolibacter sp.]